MLILACSGKAMHNTHLPCNSPYEISLAESSGLLRTLVECKSLLRALPSWMVWRAAVFNGPSNWQYCNWKNVVYQGNKLSGFSWLSQTLPGTEHIDINKHEKKACRFWINTVNLLIYSPHSSFWWWEQLTILMLIEARIVKALKEICHKKP